MNQKQKNIWINVAIIIFLIIVVSIFLIKININVDEQTAKCIGENSILYTKVGCSHCETQKQMFGENYQFLTLVECSTDPELCLNANIEGTPTWKINNQLYPGVQSIDKLKQLTGC